jgi:fructoselysine 6-kinase
MVKIAAVGDNVVDCYLARDEMYPGGNCLNLSIFLRRFGGHSAYIGAIGRDHAGDVIARALADEGVDTSHLRVLDGPTAYCVIGHRQGDRVFIDFDLGVSVFKPSAADIAFLEGFDAVHVGQSSGLDADLADIAGRASLSYDFSTRRDADHRRAIAPLCFLASVSGGDLPPETIAAIAGELLDAGAKWVLVTRGREGASLFTGANRFDVPAVPVEVVDTLGAGDTFIARVLYGLVGGETPEALLKAAASAAAETCRYYGAAGHGARIELQADISALRDIPA